MKSSSKINDAVIFEEFFLVFFTGVTLSERGQNRDGYMFKFDPRESN